MASSFKNTIVDDEVDNMENLDVQLKQILQECQQDGLSRSEMRTIFAPLTTYLNITLATGQQQNKKSWKRLIIFIIIFIILLLVSPITLISSNDSHQPSITIATTTNNFFTSLRQEFISKSLILTRLLLIHLLPYWNWSDLYYARCLVRNPYYDDQDSIVRLDDCNLCENIDQIQSIENTTQAVVMENLHRQRPLIITDGMVGWTTMDENNFYFDNITEIYLNTENYHHVCNLNTNLRPFHSNYDLNRIISKLPSTIDWFLHFENCRKDVAKVIRAFYKRPYFISNSLDFTGSNWILMSSNYKGRIWKRINTSENLSLLYQLRGSNHIRLIPKDTCKIYCPEITTTIYEGEILITTHFLWILEYIPGNDSDNLAIISEVNFSYSE